MNANKFLILVPLALACSGPDDDKPVEKGDPCLEPGNICVWMGVPGQGGLAAEGLAHDDPGNFLYQPVDISFASDGTAYFPDYNNHRIRKVDTDGIVTTVTGTGFLGDGPNNQGEPVESARDAVLQQGITVNGLPLMTTGGFSSVYDVTNLDQYYTDCVIGGPGSFAMSAETFTDFARAMRRKLVLELSSLPPERQKDEARLIRIAQAAPPARQFLPPGGYAPPRTEPYPGGCDFPMFGGFGFR